jgi:sulfite exporter TauE/SafE
MSDVSLVSFFIAGLLGGPHCFGMCGGIVGALGGVAGAAGGLKPFALHLGYNLGRVTSYVIAGAVAGGVGSSLLLTGSQGLRLALLAISGLLLIGMGLYLLGMPQVLVPLEKIGGKVWRSVQPLSRRYIPVRRFTQAYPLGLVWGWLPCGLVYTAVVAALASGSAIRGALILLAFGAGTLPHMVAAGLFAARLRGFMQQRAVRVIAGFVIVGFGLHALIGVWRLA